jgi:hypothetical protein
MFAGALGGLLFGFDTAGISDTTGGITHTYDLHNIQFLLPVLDRVRAQTKDARGNGKIVPVPTELHVS